MRTVFPIVALATVLTGLNAVKPLHVDDTTYYFNAAQTAAHPLDPYGHVLLYFDEALPALHVLAPPLLPYWWAAAIHLFGEQPVLWKLGLFPFALMFVASLAALLRRFAPAVAIPLLIALVLSPVFLPSLNLMIDIPALALSLTALVLFFRACDRDSVLLALLSGLIAGLAMQTKYTAFVAPAVLLAYALLHRQFRLGVSAAAIAVVVFTAWELALLWRYGESHFRYHSGQTPFDFLQKIGMVGCLFPLLGGVASPLLLLALTVSGARRQWLLAAVVSVLLPFVLLCWLDPVVLVVGSVPVSLSALLFSCEGAAVLLSLAWVSWRLLRRQGGQPSGAIACFLVLWLALEIAGYLALSPFPAVRRIMGIVVAATLLIGFLASQSPMQPERKIWLHGWAVVTVLLGFGFFGVDCLEARAEQQAAYDAAQLIRQEQPDAVIWYTGFWGFQYYAEKCGMKQIIPPQANGTLPASHLHRGDWLVIPDEGIPQQELDLDRPELEAASQVAVDDDIALSTLINYYGGAVPLRHRNGPRLVVRLFRVKDDLICHPLPSP